MPVRSRCLCEELENEIQFHSSFVATTLVHPATYLNKILVGSKDGELQLWNTRTWYVSASRAELD